MKLKNSVNNIDTKKFSLRMDAKMQEIMAILQDRTMLTKTGVIKLALLNLYDQEMLKEAKIKNRIVTTEEEG